MSKADERIIDFIKDKISDEITPEQLGDAVYFDRVARPKGWRSIVLVSARNITLRAQARRSGIYLERITRLGAGSKAVFLVKEER